MLRKRIIFTLIYENNYFNQSRNFRLQKVGNLNWLEKNYKFQDIAFSLDELIVLNASRENKNITEFANTLNKLVNNVFIPVAAGGGVRRIEDAKLLFDNGADKIVLNTVLYTNKNLVKELISQYGSQSIVASIDYRRVGDKNKVFIRDGREELDIELEEYLMYIENLNVGEIYLNSIERDGTGFGYDLKTVSNLLLSKLHTPLIISGGAGNQKHLLEALEIDNISAVSTANLFNFVGNGLPLARSYLLDQGVNIVKYEKLHLNKDKVF